MRRLAGAVIGGIILIFVLFWAWGYLRKGQIVISTDNSGDIISLYQANLTAADKNGASPLIKQAPSHLSASLTVGEYNVVVSGKILSVNQVVQVRAHQTLSFKLNPPVVSSPEPVANLSANSITADSSQLLFVNTDGQGLLKIDGQNNLTAIPSGRSLKSISWADPSYGLGQDDAGRLFIVNQGGLSPLQAPEAYSASKPVYAIITAGRQIYLSFGPNIYMGSQNGFKKIYSGEAPAPRFSVAKDKLAIIDSEDELTEDQNSKAHAQSDETKHKPSLFIISRDGKVTKKLNLNAIYATWSPNGQRLAVTNYDSSSDIYDASLKKLVSLPNSNTANLTWLNDDNLLYSVDNKLWSYDLGKKQSVVIANFTPGTTISEIVLDKQSQFIYTATVSSNGGRLSRIGLSGQKPALAAYRLAAFLPLSLGQCSLDFTNFSQPTVSVHFDPAVSSQSCQQVAQTELQKDGLNPSQLQFRLIRE